MEPVTHFGVAHLIAQSDAVGKTLLVLLLLMSAASWVIILAKGVAQWLRVCGILWFGSERLLNQLPNRGHHAE